jgi:NAD(P)-dependent dehydrogenase (short-subunit alcohol dehydrogenase family)
MSDLTVSSPPAAPFRVALVTGAGKRLGREIALTLARQGWDVAVHCRQSRDEAQQTAADISALGRRACVLQADLSDEAQTRALLPQAVAQLGRVDAVVNSASTFEYDAAPSFSYAMLDKHLRANTAPAIVLAQLLAEHVAARGSETDADAAVVNLLDQKLWNPNPDFLSYTLSKAALEAATTLLALALAPRVRVVGVAPGLTLTSEWLQGEKFEQLHQQSPLGRSSTPQDVALTVAFALANRSMTGTTLLVDGGQHLQRFERDFSMM